VKPIAWVDPIVEEVHAIRRHMMEECSGDFDALIKQLIKWQEEHPDRLVSYQKGKKTKQE
jgi:hypothetical protein